MSHTLITAVFDSHAHAKQAFDLLVAAGFEPRRISALMAEEVRHLVRARQEGSPLHEPSPETVRATGIGAAVGGTLAALAAAAISLTGVGLVVAGPLAAALGGAAAGATAGGFLGSLVGMGVNDDVARTYVRDLQGGALLLGVDCEPTETARVKAILREAGGRDLAAVERV